MAINLVLLGPKDRPELNLPILFGALMPDVPMLVFYLDAKLLRNLPETVIWADAYYHPGWLAVFDGFNSIPLALGGWLLATREAFPMGRLLCQHGAPRRRGFSVAP